MLDDGSDSISGEQLVGQTFKMLVSKICLSNAKKRSIMSGERNKLVQNAARDQLVHPRHVTEMIIGNQNHSVTA